MDLSALLPTALAITALSTAAGLGLMRGTVTNLREQLADCRADNATLRQTRDELHATLDALQHRVDALGREVRGEEFWAAQSVQWTTIAEELRAHHEEVMANDRAALAALREIRDRTH